MEAKLLKNGWLVQIATTADLFATVRIYPFREIAIGPFPMLYDSQELWPAVAERIQVNLQGLIRSSTQEERIALRDRMISKPSGACYVFTERQELKTHLKTILELFGETPATARRRANLWIAAAEHNKMPHG